MKKGVFLIFLFSILLVVSFGENVSSQVGGGGDDCCGYCQEDLCDFLETVCSAYDAMWDSWCEVAGESIPDDCSFSCWRGSGGPCIASCPFFTNCVVVELSPIEELLLSPGDCTSLQCALAGCWATKTCGPYWYNFDCNGGGGGGECDGLPCPPPPPPPPPPPTCGDGVCEGFPEFCGNCEEDCGTCDPPPPDCGLNGVCDGPETCDNCWEDCWMECGEECGDGVCEGGETCDTCENDCGDCGGGECGDGVCENPGETCVNCFTDCGICGEGSCGDGIVQQPNDENPPIYEECDDGDNEDGDGCSSECELEGCHLRSNFYLAGDNNDNFRADAGERIQMFFYLLGDCIDLGSFNELVIEGYSIGGSCIINPLLGDMAGMVGPTNGGSTIWTVPTIPQDCEGEQIYGMNTYLRYSGGNSVIESTNVTGSFIFFGDAGEDTFCGDGHIQEPNDENPPIYEECDDGNSNNEDSCIIDEPTNYVCMDAYCGDGFNWTMDGGLEECDDGMECVDTGIIDGASCVADPVICSYFEGTCELVTWDGCVNCLIEEDTFCGDGIVQQPNSDGLDETCDDGNNDNDDGCSAGCFLENNVDCDGLVGQEGWFGEYYNYPKAHPDMDREMGNQPTGDPLNWNEDWEHDWYDDSYYRFYRIDDDLEFGQEFFPFDMAPEEFEENGHEHYFGTHWRALVTSDESRDYLYSLRSDDDSWMYITSTSGLPELIADNSGIHNANDAVQNIINFEKDITYTVDVFFAERKTESSELTFSFHSPTGELEIVPFLEDCEEIIGPSLEAEWYGSAPIGENVTMHVDVTNIVDGETILFELYDDDSGEGNDTDANDSIGSYSSDVSQGVAEIEVELAEDLFVNADDDRLVDKCDFNNNFELVFNATLQDSTVNATSVVLAVWCGNMIPLFTIEDVPFFGFAQGIAVVILIILIYFFLSRKQVKKKKK